MNIKKEKEKSQNKVTSFLLVPIIIAIIFLLISCSSEDSKNNKKHNSITESNPVVTIIDLITDEPTSWTFKYNYDGNYIRTGDFTHKSGVVVTRTFVRKWSYESWSNAVDNGWSITKPIKIVLTDSESQDINDVYEKWNKQEIINAKNEVNKLLKSI